MKNVNIQEHWKFFDDFLDLLVNFFFNNTNTFHFGGAQVYFYQKNWLATGILRRICALKLLARASIVFAVGI